MEDGGSSVLIGVALEGGQDAYGAAFKMLPVFVLQAIYKLLCTSNSTQIMTALLLCTIRSM